MMLDTVIRGEAASRLLSEVRALEDRFGLSPAARRRLQWDVRPMPLAVPDSAPADDDQRFLRLFASRADSCPVCESTDMNAA
jgi:hypothetical protein